MCKETLAVLSALVLIMVTTGWADSAAAGAEHIDQEEESQVYRAVVLEVQEEEPASTGHWGDEARKQQIKVRFTSGERAGEKHILENQLTGNPAYDIDVSEGNRVLIGETAGQLYVMDFARDTSLGLLILAFVACLLIVAGRRGASVVTTLALTGLAVYYVMIPAVLAGRDPVLTTILTSTAIVALTGVLVLGFRGKTLAAAAGTAAGVTAAAAVAHIWGHLTHLMGLHTQDAQMLYHTAELSIDFRGLLLSGMILGALGAIIDVCVSIASAVQEIHNADPSLSLRSLFRSGLEVGRDVLGTMANTLILAYAGGALPLLLLLSVHQMQYIKIANLDLIATEVVRALSGSIGMVLCVPVTALAAAYIQTLQSRGTRRSRTRRR